MAKVHPIVEETEEDHHETADHDHDHHHDPPPPPLPTLASLRLPPPIRLPSSIGRVAVPWPPPEAQHRPQHHPHDHPHHRGGGGGGGGGGEGGHTPPDLAYPWSTPISPVSPTPISSASSSSPWSAPVSPAPSSPWTALSMASGNSSPTVEKKQPQQQHQQQKQQAGRRIVPGLGLGRPAADRQRRPGGFVLATAKSWRRNRRGAGAGAGAPENDPAAADGRAHAHEVRDRHDYLVTLCQAMMMEYMGQSAKALDVRGHFLYLPGCMVLSLEHGRRQQLGTADVKLVRAQPGINLLKMRDVHHLYKEVVHGRLCVAAAQRRLDAVVAAPDRFGTAPRVLAYGLVSAFVAPVAFQGRLVDMPLAFALGAACGFLQLVVAPRNQLYAHVLEITAAVLNSFLARALGSARGGHLFCFSALAQSSIALILPGFMVVCAALELQSQKIVAGSVRMVYALIYTLFLGYSIAIGTALYGLLDRDGASSAVACERPLDPPWWALLLLLVPGFCASLCVVTQADWRQMPAILAISLAGFAANSYSARLFRGRKQASTMFGALAVGILANLYSRTYRHLHWLCERCTRTRWWRAARGRRGRRASVRSEPDDGAAGDDDDAGCSQPPDVESGCASSTSATAQEWKSRCRWGPAAAVMLPAIFVQVPSDLAVGGSLLWGVTEADALTHRMAGDPNENLDGMDISSLNMLLNVIQIAIGVTIGLFLSALIVYPLGKRRSGLLSF
ncbi:hypothetical protein GGR56DRAFT_682181 [Xylariaceae sp. FL0804]|nr:hypothetical protein GGR56DRAFT_682181 [Xylariaceae sp. FL0804]